MATKVEDTLEPSGVSGSGLYGTDTASVKGDRSSESLISDDDTEILRLSIQGFDFGRAGPSSWEDIVIYRAGHRKVEIQLLDNLDSPPDWEEGPLFVIDLDNAVFVPLYLNTQRCVFRRHENAAFYWLSFKTMLDLFKFQEVFTGFSVQTHIPDVRVRLRPLHQKRKWDTKDFRTAVQLWRKVPTQHESFNITTDAPHNQPHAWSFGEGRARSAYEGSSMKKIDTPTASHVGLNPLNDSAMETPASSFLVFGGRYRLLDLSMIPLDGRTPNKGHCRCNQSEEWCNHITFGKDNANTRSQQTPSLEDTPANRLGAIGWTAMSSSSWSKTLALSSMASSATVSRSSNELGWVQLEFRTIEDKKRFELAFGALERQHGPHLGEEKLHPDYKSSKEQGSLTGYESAAFDAGAGLFDIEFDGCLSEEETMQPSLRHKSIPNNDMRSKDGSKRTTPFSDLTIGSKDGSKRTTLFSDITRRSKEGSKRTTPFSDPTVRSKEGSKRTSLLALPTFESELSTSSISETSGCDGCEKQGSTSETQVNRKIRRASIETSAKQEQWRRRICRRIIVFMLWKREQNVCLPNELWSSPASFEFISVLEVSPFDKIKGLFETYSGMEWDWWPFAPTVKPLDSGKVRIRWQCACGDQRWTDASRYLARRCQALANENTPAGHERGNATSQSAGSAASHSQSGSVVPGSFPSDTSQSIEDTSNICSEAQASHNQTTYKNSNSKDLYVLLCIYQQSQILHSQILATKCQNDEAFFENLRKEYRRLRGFFRFWFSPLQFSHCDFVKFTRFYVNELAKVGHSLPIDLIYQYNPRPPGPHEDPPISPHEFRRRFYTHLTNPCGRDEALVRIPKRQKQFQIHLHVDGREDMWGLHVELRPCFLIVLMWQIIVTAGGWAFMGWWLSRYHGDLQNAAIPVTLIVTAIMALWAPIGKGMKETL